MSQTRNSVLLSGGLWLLVLGLLAALSLRHEIQIDWTANARNTLSAPSIAQLKAMPDPIVASAYVFPNTEVHREISARFAPYKRARADFSLRFVDPTTDPQTVRELGIDQSGEVVITYQGRRETLKTLSEPDITAALQRLAYAAAANIVFISGHGERDPRGEDQAGYSALSKILLNKGLKLRSFPLAIQAVPDGIDLLVLAAPQQGLLPGEVERLKSYLAAGGNLLWLSDPNLPTTPDLAATLGLEQQSGTVIYQDYATLGTGHPALALIAEYPSHALSAALSDLSAYAYAGGWRSAANASADDWQRRPLLRSVKRSWLETGVLDGDLIYEQDTDTLGPIDIAWALQRMAPEQEQRVIVVADSDFLSNAYLNQLGNRAVAIALFQWLIQRDSQIAIDLPPAPDRQLQLSPLATRIIALVFVLVLPVGFLSIGVLRWWLRGRRR